MSWVPPNSEYPPPKIGEPPLHRAAREGDHETIRRLVRDGADIDSWFDLALDPGGREFLATPLMVAAGSGYGATVETMELLVNCGADVSLRGPAGSCAFFAASGLGWNYPHGGDAARLAFALSHGCNPNEVDDRSVSVLAAAARTSDPERVRLLLAAGANPNPEWDQVSALARHERMKQHFGPTIASVIEEPIGPMAFQIPLFAAVEADSIEAVLLLLDAGAHIAQRDDGNRTVLFLVGSPEVARLLVARGADIEARDRFNWTPLKNAVGESVAHVRALLAAGANPNATCDRGYTVFMGAASSSERSVEILQALVAGGANPFAVSELGYNALHAAIDVNGEANAEESVRAILSYLVELGIDPEQRNNAGETPLDRARNWGTAVEVGVMKDILSRPRPAATFEDAWEIKKH